MLSKVQVEVIEKNVRIVHEAFLKCGSIAGVVELTKIPRSSVQRYLTCDLASEIFGEEEIDRIRKILEETKLAGKRKGGMNFARNNISTKDELGHFTGSKRK